MQKQKEASSKRSHRESKKTEVKRKQTAKTKRQQTAKTKRKSKDESKAIQANASVRVPKSNKRRRHSVDNGAPPRGMKKTYGYAVAAVFIAIGIVLFMMLFTFTSADLLDGTPQVLNIFGIVGAHIANIMLQLFGLSSFFFSIICLLMGLITLCGRPFEVRAKEMLGLCLLIIGSSPLFSLAFERQLFLDHSPGGVLGAWIAQNAILQMSLAGVYASTLTLSFIGLLFVTDTSFRSFFKGVFKLVKTLASWLFYALRSPLKKSQRQEALVAVPNDMLSQEEDYDKHIYYDETPSEILSEAPASQETEDFRDAEDFKAVQFVNEETEAKLAPPLDDVLESETPHQNFDRDDDLYDPDNLANIDFRNADFIDDEDSAKPEADKAEDESENGDSIAAILDRIKINPKMRKSPRSKSVPALEPEFEFDSIIAPEKLAKGQHKTTHSNSVLADWKPRSIAPKTRETKAKSLDLNTPRPPKYDIHNRNEAEFKAGNRVIFAQKTIDAQSKAIPAKRPIYMTEDILAKCDDGYSACAMNPTKSIQDIDLNPDAVTREAAVGSPFSLPESAAKADREDPLSKLARQHGLKLPDKLISAQTPDDSKNKTKANQHSTLLTAEAEIQNPALFKLNTTTGNAAKTRALLDAQAIQSNLANFDIRPSSGDSAKTKAPEQRIDDSAKTKAPEQRIDDSGKTKAPERRIDDSDDTEQAHGETRTLVPVREPSSFLDNKALRAASESRNQENNAAQLAKPSSFVVSEGKHKASEDELNEAEKALVKKLGKVKTYQYPPLSLLKYKSDPQKGYQADELQELADKIKEKLAEYKVEGEVVQICPGPIITRFEFQPAPGTKVSRIAGLSDDLMMALEILSIRILAPIPGKNVVGIEIPNEFRNTIYLKEVIGSKSFIEAKSVLTMALGQDSEGEPVVSDLAKMPHLLVAGATGSGKSVGINTMLCSLLYNARPDELKLILVDPKCLELSIYKGIPHLLVPPITTPKETAAALDWACDEMDRRYQLLAELGVRNILGYNERIKNPPDKRTIRRLGKLDEDGEKLHKNLPYIVIVVDEFADLMMVSGKEIETSIARLAQKARAAGIHIILATQRPSTNVITGIIKANFPTRMAFRVFSVVDSRTILDSKGAEALLGMGDSLFLPPNSGLLQRVHGAYVSDEDVQAVVDFLTEHGEAEYDESILRPKEELESDDYLDSENQFDALYDKAVAVVANAGQASASYLQRRMSIGFNRAARLIDQMEREGVVGPANGQKPRDVLIDPL